MRITLTLFFLISVFQIYGQKCETFDRELFHMLPEQFPDTVNCVDKNEQKQGWWLIYKIKHNPINIPDELEKGDYVKNYSYGQYKDDRKIETWKLVENVHQVYERKIDRFYYSKDSIVINSAYADQGWHETKTFYNADSSIIQYSHLLPKEKYPIVINCDKTLPTGKGCIMTYRETELKKFPIDRFEIERKFLPFDYLTERKLIDKRKE